MNQIANELFDDTFLSETMAYAVVDISLGLGNEIFILRHSRNLTAIFDDSMEILDSLNQAGEINSSLRNVLTKALGDMKQDYKYGENNSQEMFSALFKHSILGCESESPSSMKFDVCATHLNDSLILLKLRKRRDLVEKKIQQNQDQTDNPFRTSTNSSLYNSSIIEQIKEQQ